MEGGRGEGHYPGGSWQNQQMGPPICCELGGREVLDTHSPGRGLAEKSETKSHLTGPEKREVGGLLPVYKYHPPSVRVQPAACALGGETGAQAL